MLFKTLDIKIGDVLHSIINHKCKLIKDIFEEIENKELKEKYLNELEIFKEVNHNEVNKYYYKDYPVTYYLEDNYIEKNTKKI